MDGPRRPRRASGAFAHQAAASAAAASSRAFLHAAALSWEIKVLLPTFMVRGPHPSRRILKYISSEMPCRRQNSLIDIASAFGSAPGGLRRYFGPRSAVTIGLRHSPRAIAVASLKLDGRRYGGDGILPMSELSGAQNAQFGSGGLTLFAAERALPRRAVRN